MSKCRAYHATAYGSMPHHRRHAVQALVCTGDMLCMLCYAQCLLAKTVCLPGGLVSKMFSGLMSAWTTPLLCIKAKQPCRVNTAAGLCVGNCHISIKHAHATKKPIMLSNKQCHAYAT